MTYKIYLERPPYDHSIKVFLGFNGGDAVKVALPSQIEYKTMARNQAVSEPWLNLEAGMLISMHDSLGKELQRLGLIPAHPTDLERVMLRNQLDDAIDSRNKALAILGDIHKPEPSKMKLEIEIVNLKAQLEIAHSQLENELRRNARAGQG